MKSFTIVQALILSVVVALLPSAMAQDSCSAIGNGYYPHHEYCDGFNECINGTLVGEGLCPDGLVLNPYGGYRQLRCELPYNIDCGSRTALQPPQPTKYCRRKYGMFRQDDDCSKYWHCVDGYAYQGACPEGLAFDEDHGICAWSDQVLGCESLPTSRGLVYDCPEFNIDRFQLEGNPRFPDPTDCKALYVCIAYPQGQSNWRFIPRLLSCEDGYVFNPNTKQCDEPENVEGCQNYYPAEYYEEGYADAPNALSS